MHLRRRSVRFAALAGGRQDVADDQSHDRPIAFGPFRLTPKARLLEKEGAALHIGGRALDILMFLAARPGEVVDKRELMKQVWANVHVDEGSLRFHVTVLRKALGDTNGAQYIKNVPGRGYCFVARPVCSEASAAPPSASTASPGPLPSQIARLIGRAEAVEKISADIMLHRVVTIVGPGGMGKTSVAVAVAHRQFTEFRGLIFFIDFSGLTDVSLVPSTIASALGLTVSSQDPTPDVLAFLRERRALLILDSCEHVLEPLAPLAERLARDAPEARLLATSREALRIESECVFRLFPLSYPQSHQSVKAADISSYPAAQLFLERVAPSLGGMGVSEEDAGLVAEICRRLDGIPLAIELAAGRVDSYGIAGTASLLDSHLSLLWRGRRTAIPRHQTLSAALGWSYDLLPQTEGVALRRLSVFAGAFTLEAAIAVASHQGLSKFEAADAIASLTAKSLVATTSERPLRYRLLDMTRTFAREKLLEAGDADRAARAHAEYFRDFLNDISVKSSGLQSDGRFLSLADQVSNVRAALDWSFSGHGDVTVGVALAASATQFFLGLSLLTECQRWTQQAVTMLGATTIGGRQEMELQAALGVSVMFMQSNTEAVRSALTRSLQLAEELGDRYWQLWLLQLFQIYCTRIGDLQGSLDAGTRAEAIARILNDPSSMIYVEWALGVAHHMIGNQQRAVELCETAMLQNPTSQRSYTLHMGFDNRTFALFTLSRALWLTGRPDSAVATARYTISEAERVQQPLSLSLALLFTIPIFLWIGDWANAAPLIDRLIDHTGKHALGPHHAVGIGFKGELLIRRGELDDGIDHLARSQATLRATRYRLMTTVFGTTQAESRAQLGQFDDAIRIINECIAQMNDRGESFDLPEMLRVKGDILRSLGRPDEAETWFRQSLEVSRRQCALGWELRAAVALGRLWREKGRGGEARALIEPLYRRYDEGLASMDLVAAKMLLDSLNM
jgi:predicted ATPase/DNA-binding winged helix-turn-helix (wHTH) protein